MRRLYYAYWVVNDPLEYDYDEFEFGDFDAFLTFLSQIEDDCLAGYAVLEPVRAAYNQIVWEQIS